MKNSNPFVAVSVWALCTMLMLSFMFIKTNGQTTEVLGPSIITDASSQHTFSLVCDAVNNQLYLRCYTSEIKEDCLLILQKTYDQENYLDADIKLGYKSPVGLCDKLMYCFKEEYQPFLSVSYRVRVVYKSQGEEYSGMVAIASSAQNLNQCLTKGIEYFPK